MDGSDRRVLHSIGLTWPNGLTVDYLAQKIYWVDANQDRIEYSNIDGSGRFILLSGLDHPFSITLEGDLLFWTDWLNDAIHVTHKISGTSGSNLTLYSNLRDRPFGIEAVTPTRQTQNGEFSFPPSLIYPHPSSLPPQQLLILLNIFLQWQSHVMVLHACLCVS